MEKFLLVGNPNTGKTTLFNALTKSNEHVGNWHGVTVSEKAKNFTINKEKFEIVDLPGLYSLTPLSFEEKVAANFIYENDCKIINICDINNLQRNLYLTLQLLEVNREVVLFVNTMKKKVSDGLIKNAERALEKLNITYFIGNPNNKADIKKFKQKLLNKFNKVNLNYLEKIKNEINIKNKLKINNNSEYALFRAVEGDELFFEKYFKENKNELNIIFNLNKLEKIIKIRQDFINDLFINTSTNKKVYGASKLDRVLLNKYLCLPIFFGILFLVFYLTFFSVGAFFSDLLRSLIQDVIGEGLINFLSTFIKSDWVIDLFEVGIIGGVGSLIAFLPQVILLFFFLSIIEDSGYLARVAFMFEDIFAKVGLSGKSVYTLLMGFGCSTTAALTARNMEDKNAKIKTALLTPYMSCSAKLPIYAVIGGAFFLKCNIFIIFGLYILGVVVALLLSLFLEKTSLKSKEQSFILEFPEYRMPSVKRVLLILWDNVKSFLLRVGTLLVSVNVIIWVLQSFSFKFEYVPQVSSAKSMLQVMGEIIAPIFSPLGFGNWGAASALLSGLIAKEVVVSSIAMINGVNIHGADIKNQTMTSLLTAGAVVSFTHSSALSFMVFCLLYSPCLATLSVFRKEIGKKWTYLSVLIQFVIAYIASFVVYQLSHLFMAHGFWMLFEVLVGVIIIILSVWNLYKKIKRKKLCLKSGNCGDCKGCDFKRN